MTGHSITKNILTVGNIIKNLVKDEDNILQMNPDIQYDGKITKLMSKFIITPSVIVDKSLEYTDPTVMKNIIKTEMALFTGVVTEALRVMIEIHGAAPMHTINTLGRDRLGSLDDIKRVIDLAEESIDHTSVILDSDKFDFLPIGNITAGTEETVKPGQFIYKDTSAFANVYELSFKFESEKGNDRVLTIPLIVYPNIIFTEAENLLNNMLDSKSDKTFLTRIDDYRAGAISLADLIFATDLVKKYKKKKVSNENDLANMLNRLDKTGTVKDLLHNRKNFSRNFNIYILNETTIPLINKRVRGNIFKGKYKDILTDTLLAFSVSLLDVEKEELSILIDEIPGFSILTYSMLAKDKNIDVNDISKSLLANKSPF